MAQALKKTNYHHGNLKQALVAAALELLENHSPDELSLRRLAAALGVSQSAVYSHFADKTALTAAIAAHGFHLQAEAMTVHLRDVRDPYERIIALAVASMEFAFDNRALYQVMFSRAVQDIDAHKTLALAAGKPYALFAAAWSRFAPEQSARTAAVWAMIHGMTMFMCDPKFAPAITRGRDTVQLVRDSFAAFRED